ncbi:MAG: 50S ribosomal protein L11 methyltransferase [Acidobacteria bacterium]|nr:50S ribosomal protein L11 methyltransferase [Acidobacteriota bacterium]
MGETRFRAALDLHLSPATNRDRLIAALDDLDLFAIDDGRPDVWRMFFFAPEARERAQASLLAAFPPPILSAVPLDVPDERWAERAQRAQRAIVVDRFIVAPPWDVPAAHAERTIVIQPSTGFGTGHHASTRLCLCALQRLDVGGRTVLDVGTGSGLLAIAAARLGARRVVAIDVDADAVEAARDNVARNGCEERVELGVADVREWTGDSADVVLANLTGRFLVHNAPRLMALLASGGHLVASGFTRQETDDVTRALAEHGSVVAEDEEDEWAAVTVSGGQESTVNSQQWKRDG